MVSVLRTFNRVRNAIANNNQIGLITIVNSGETFNIITGDLNRDGVADGDRPVGIGRNAGRLPATISLDARFSRHFTLRDDLSLELFAEGSNVLNRKNILLYNSTSLTAGNVTNSQVNPLTGELRSPLPDFRNLSVTFRESRQLQFGVKLHF